MLSKKLIWALVFAVVTVFLVNWVLENSDPRLMRYSGTGGLVAGAVVGYLVWSGKGKKIVKSVTYN
tara:strand:+ start:147 stop:344 length:198 start_codon:yes stop_codon:yes gene_type:complete